MCNDRLLPISTDKSILRMYEMYVVIGMKVMACRGYCMVVEWVISNERERVSEGVGTYIKDVWK